MRGLITKLKSDRILLRGFLISFILGILTAGYILIEYSQLPPFIPIFNQLPWGDQRFMTTLGIFVPIAIFSIIFVINLVAATIVYSKNPLISRVIAATTLLIAIMQFIFVIRTILVIL